MNRSLISTRTAVALATVGLVLATGPAICQTVGKTAAVNPAATSAGKTLTLGSSIIHKQRINTDTGGSVQVLFLDRSTLNIGPNSDVLIDEYVFDPVTNSGKMSVSLGKGLMRFVGGQISHDGNAQVKTPSATIGIRGAVGTFSYDPRTKVTKASNDCAHCTLTLFSNNGQSVLIPPGQTATVGGDGSAKLGATTRQDTDRNLKATQSKSGQTGGAGKGTSNQAAGISGSKPVVGGIPAPTSSTGGLGNESTIKEHTQTTNTTSGNTGAKVSPPPPPPPPPPPCHASARGCF